MLRHIVIATILAAGFLSANAQTDWDAVEIKTESVGNGIYVLFGRGGNIAISVGEDGVIMIDDQYAPLTGKILAAVKTITDKPVDYVINTHWHGDHTGGNENMDKAQAVILGHSNVRARLGEEQFNSYFDRKTPPSPQAALPVITFEDRLKLFFNELEIDVFHVMEAHTDGDSIVHFKGANVIHMGDTYFNGWYPYIDASSGGSLIGFIDAMDDVLALSDDKTVIIPGHGPVSNKAELQKHRDALEALRVKLEAELTAGKSDEAILSAGPLQGIDHPFKPVWLDEKRFLEIVLWGMRMEMAEADSVPEE